MNVTDTAITGTLYPVTGYTGFSGSIDEQSGYYLALKFIATEGATTTIQLLGGDSPERDPVMLDSDMNAVLRISDTNKDHIRTQLKVTTSMTGHETVVKTYALTGLTFLTSIS